MNLLKTLLIIGLPIFTYGQSAKDVGRLIKYENKLNKIIKGQPRVEVIAEGFDWSEGPLVINDTFVIFSDVPRNTIYRWTPNTGSKVYLTPSGYTGTKVRGGETGSNGLALNMDRQLILCQHGDRQIALMESSIYDPNPVFKTLSNNYMGKKFDSPNDVCIDSKGEYFFTDPPYGLEKYISDPAKESLYQGVYKIDKKGVTTLLVDTITRPNGIAFLPGNKQLIVANSDPDKPHWYIYEYDGIKLRNGRIFYDAKSQGKKLKGLPDGFKIDKKGNVFATGPGGVYIFDKKGNKLGLIELDNPSSNCALTADEKTLYITNDMYLVRVKLR